MVAAAVPSAPELSPQHRRPRRPVQLSFFCPCGRPLASRSAVCRECRQARFDSRRRFGGNRESVLERDGRRCRGCGAGKTLHVHHRRPGFHERRWLVTLCAACHARVHHLSVLRGWLPKRTVRLWQELHPRAPRQLQFPFERLAA